MSALQGLATGLIYLPASIVIQDHRPQIGKNRYANKVTDEIWNNLSIAKNWHAEEGFHEEISFERSAKGFALFYTSGQMTYDLGVSEDLDGTDCYYRIVKDEREKHRVIGAPIEVKLKAFRHLKILLNQIFLQASELNTSILIGDGRGDGFGYGNGNGDGSGNGAGFGNADGSGFGNGNY